MSAKAPERRRRRVSRAFAEFSALRLCDFDRAAFARRGRWSSSSARRRAAGEDRDRARREDADAAADAQAPPDANPTPPPTPPPQDAAAATPQRRTAAAIRINTLETTSPAVRRETANTHTDGSANGVPERHRRTARPLAAATPADPPTEPGAADRRRRRRARTRTCRANTINGVPAGDAAARAAAGHHGRGAGRSVARRKQQAVVGAKIRKTPSSLLNNAALKPPTRSQRSNAGRELQARRGVVSVSRGVPVAVTAASGAGPAT